jgi:hypothetical protein
VAFSPWQPLWNLHATLPPLTKTFIILLHFSLDLSCPHYVMDTITHRSAQRGRQVTVVKGNIPLCMLSHGFQVPVCMFHLVHCSTERGRQNWCQCHYHDTQAELHQAVRVHSQPGFQQGQQRLLVQAFSVLHQETQGQDSSTSELRATALYRQHFCSLFVTCEDMWPTDAQFQGRGKLNCWDK